MATKTIEEMEIEHPSVIEGQNYFSHPPPGMTTDQWTHLTAFLSPHQVYMLKAFASNQSPFAKNLMKVITGDIKFGSNP